MCFSTHVDCWIVVLQPGSSRCPLLLARQNADGESGEAGQRFNYLFYVDFIGSTSHVTVQNALRHLRVRCDVAGRALLACTPAC